MLCHNDCAQMRLKAEIAIMNYQSKEKGTTAGPQSGTGTGAGRGQGGGAGGRPPKPNAKGGGGGGGGGGSKGGATSSAAEAAENEARIKLGIERLDSFYLVLTTERLSGIGADILRAKLGWGKKLGYVARSRSEGMATVTTANNKHHGRPNGSRNGNNGNNGNDGNSGRRRLSRVVKGVVSGAVNQAEAAHFEGGGGWRAVAEAAAVTKRGLSVAGGARRDAQEEAVEKLGRDGEAEGWTIESIEACHSLDIRLHDHAKRLEDREYAAIGTA